MTALTIKAADRIITGNRIPYEFFSTRGVGDSDIAIHAGSYHLALKDAGIESFNIITYSSILPQIARKIDKPQGLVHGSVMETIMAAGHFNKGESGAAGIIYGWLRNKQTRERFGGLVCEHAGLLSEEQLGEQLNASLQELYTNGFSDTYDLEDIELTSVSHTATKTYGTALVALCFTSYIHPVKINGAADIFGL